MIGRPIDFQGVVNLDQKLVENLKIYLKGRESYLVHQILESNDPMPIEAFKPLLSISGVELKLSEAIEGFTKKIRLSALKKSSSDQTQHTLHVLNKALWDYTEILESCVTELFLQVDQLNLDRWHLSLQEVVFSIKDLLLHKIEDLAWTVKRVEASLTKSEEKKGWFDWLKPASQAIDPSILKNLHQTDSYLKKKYEQFIVQYHTLESLNLKVAPLIEEIKTFPGYIQLDSTAQAFYVDFSRLLELLKSNSHLKGNLAKDTVRSIKNIASIEGVIRLLRLYFKLLEENVFKCSHELKSFDKDSFKTSGDKLRIKISDYRKELSRLLETMGDYRHFILRHDPDPYVSSRWGFSEWVVAEEPEKAKKLLNLIYSTNDLSKSYDRFYQSLERDPVEQQKREMEAHDEIEKLLHEMGQPLISRSMISDRAKKLLEEINFFDELYTPRRGTIVYIGEVLSKAMREDWKYHVLHGFTAFHEIFRIHRGLLEGMNDPVHAFRVERFHHLFKQIEEWIEKGDLSLHLHEIEYDMNDMKTYLQDFLASIQRSEKEKSGNLYIDETIDKYKNQLLEYRFLFGEFFYLMLKQDGRLQYLRNRFLFVDQYFESVEELIQKMNHRTGF